MKAVQYTGILRVLFKLSAEANESRIERFRCIRTATNFFDVHETRYLDSKSLPDYLENVVWWFRRLRNLTPLEFVEANFSLEIPREDLSTKFLVLTLHSATAYVIKLSQNLA